VNAASFLVVVCTGLVGEPTCAQEPSAAPQQAGDVES
jgi:hypothetical protein